MFESRQQAAHNISSLALRYHVKYGDLFEKALICLQNLLK